MSLVVPAVLPSSKREFDEKLALFATLPSVSRIQIDVVDGKFASPASWPCSAPEELQTMVAHAGMLPHLDRFEYEIDLMCLDAERAADAWLALGATRLTFHAESTTDLPRLLASAQDRYGSFITFGAALDVANNPAVLEPCLGEVGYVQFMGIARAGRQGEPFDRRVIEKVGAFRHQHPDIPIQVDGGVSLLSAPALIVAGATSLVVGSAILHADNPSAAVAAFEALKSPYGV